VEYRESLRVGGRNHKRMWQSGSYCSLNEPQLSRKHTRTKRNILHIPGLSRTVSRVLLKRD
jgi:hypothetical protein